jgi:hypothetical protein
MAGIYLIISDFVEINSLINNEFILLFAYLAKQGTAAIAIKPYGPHNLPEYLTQPVRIYKPKIDRNLIAVENRNRTVIYQ